MAASRKKKRVKRPSPPEEEQLPTQRWANNKSELAGILGVSRQTLYNWQKLPDCPSARSNGKYSVEEWIEFGQEMSTLDMGQGDPFAKHVWEIKLLKQKWERMQWKFEVDRNEWTSNAIIADEVRRLVAEAVSVLRDELEVKAPISHRPRNRSAIDRAMSRLHRGAEDIAAKFPSPAPHS